jgi:hypothetical protein
MSGAPPAGNGTTKVTGRVGHDCAAANEGSTSAAIAAAHTNPNRRSRGVDIVFSIQMPNARQVWLALLGPGVTAF